MCGIVALVIPDFGGAQCRVRIIARYIRIVYTYVLDLRRTTCARASSASLSPARFIAGLVAVLLVPAGVNIHTDQGGAG